MAKCCRTISLIIILCCIVCGAAFADENHFLWKVRGSGDTEVYLLGSIHMLTKELYPLAPEIEDAWQRSDVLAVEADVRNPDEAAVGRIMMAKGVYGPGGSLKQDLGEELYAEVISEFESYGLPEEQIRMFKPWVAALMLQSFQYQELGYEAEYGIDMHFLSRVDDSKRVEELESVTFQIELLSSLRPELQKSFLVQTLEMEDEVAGQLEIIVAAWKSGNVEELEELLYPEDPDYPHEEELNTILNVERNRNMARKIQEYLESDDETYFVVVGAAHLVGDENIRQLLEENGYRCIQQ
jgi:hypothetical protein